jgi:hypothetical protein
MKHITYDIETIGTNAKAPIVQIAAVKFDKEKVLSEFYTNVDLSSLQGLDLEVEYSTLGWWLEQDNDITKSVFSQTSAFPLNVTLKLFQKWIEEDKDSYLFWTHKDFDPPILKANFAACGMDVDKAIPFRNNMDIRTLEFMSKMKLHETVPNKENHNALADARCQAKFIQICLNSNEK